MQLCTLTDQKYLPYGRALLRSLIAQKEVFTLHWLCIDQKTYEIVSGFKERGLPVEPTFITELALQKFNHPEYRAWVWMLASQYCNWLLQQKRLPEILYIDADIYFYRPVSDVLAEIGDRSVGIIRHQFIPLSEPDPIGCGYYNVGIVYFRNDGPGAKCCSWWADAVINQRYLHLATCYDQKYLDEFVLQTGPAALCVLEKIGYSAPWDYWLYDWSKPLVFNHFSRFKGSLVHPTNNEYPEFTHNFKDLEHPKVKALYEHYAQELKNELV